MQKRQEGWNQEPEGKKVGRQDHIYPEREVSALAEKYTLLEDIMRGDYGEEVKAAVEGMTDKQKFFCMEYIIDMNGAQAAIRAGYSEKTARDIAYENMAKPDIKLVIDVLLKKREKRTEVTQDRVLLELAKIAFSDLNNFVEYGPNGVKLKDSSTVDGTMVAEVSQSKHGRKIKLHDKLKALELLGRHLAMFVDRQQVEDITPGRAMNIEEMKRLIQLIEAEKAQK